MRDTIFITATAVFVASIALYLLIREPNLVGTNELNGTVHAQSKAEIAEQPPGYVFDVMLDTPQKLEELLTRVAELAQEPRSNTTPTNIVLVLHGPEVEMFAIKNYSTHKKIVDLAARLDAFNIVDIKMCQTRMDFVGLTREDIPAFIELVPFGPAEVQKLRREAYITL